MQYFRLLGMDGLQPDEPLPARLGDPDVHRHPGVDGHHRALPPSSRSTASRPRCFPSGSALGLYVVFMFMYLAPKLAGFLDIALTKGGLARYGGGLRFALGAMTELLFSFLVSAR